MEEALFGALGLISLRLDTMVHAAFHERDAAGHQLIFLVNNKEREVLVHFLVAPVLLPYRVIWLA